MAEILQFVIVTFKVLIPASMLKLPVFGLWGNYFLDVADGDILLSLGMNEASYQLIDKSTDLISYIFMLILGLRWSIRKTIIILFRQKEERKAYVTYQKHFILIWAVVLIYKIWNEWYLHWANIDLSKLFFGFTGGS